jgi:hypothetical protein
MSRGPIHKKPDLVGTWKGCGRIQQVPRRLRVPSQCCENHVETPFGRQLVGRKRYLYSKHIEIFLDAQTCGHLAAQPSCNYLAILLSTLGDQSVCVAYE